MGEDKVQRVALDLGGVAEVKEEQRSLGSYENGKSIG